jgi:hypothetical protein
MDNDDNECWARNIGDIKAKKEATLSRGQHDGLQSDHFGVAGGSILLFLTFFMRVATEGVFNFLPLALWLGNSKGEPFHNAIDPLYLRNHITRENIRVSFHPYVHVRSDAILVHVMYYGITYQLQLMTRKPK